MGKNLVKLTGFRIADETILPKLDVIAARHHRTRNKEVEYILDEYVQAYEREHGVIDIKRDDAD